MIEDNPEIPEIELDISIAEVKPRKLRAFSHPPEPSAIDRMAALSDPEVAEKVSEFDDWERRYQEMVEDLRSLWGHGL